MIENSELVFMIKKSPKKKTNPFKKSKKEKFKIFWGRKGYVGLSNSLFGEFVDKHPNLFSSLKQDLMKGNFHTLSRTYFCELLLTPLLVYLVSFLLFLVIFILSKLPIMFRGVLLIMGPFALALFSFTIFFLYPSIRVKARKASIETNLPFALNHMSAVTGSGIPPSALFTLLTNFQEYGELSAEASRILKRIKIFGEDLVTALKTVAKKTPSEAFMEVLYGIISTLESGGSLKKYLQEKSKTALFDYKIRRKKHIQNLSVYASVYTAILVAAPLFLIAVLSVLNLMGGNLLGFEIEKIMYGGVYFLIPLINLIFLIFLSTVQKEM